MASKYLLKISKSDGSDENIQIQIPTIIGNHTMQVEMQNGSILNAGNIIVSEEEYKYHLDFTLSNGNVISLKDVKTPVVVYKFDVVADERGYILCLNIKAGTSGAIIKYAGITKNVNANTEEKVTITTSETNQTSGTVTIYGATSASIGAYDYTDSEGKSHTERWIGITRIVYIDYSWKTIPTNFLIEQNVSSDIEIPDTITTIDTGAFQGCPFKNFSFTSSVKEISTTAFSYVNLDKVNYKGTIKDWCQIYFYTSDSNPASKSKSLYFNNEIVLQAIIPNEITEIKPYCFYGSKLIYAELPNTITKIGMGAFTNSNQLERFKFNGTIEQWNSVEKYSNWKDGCIFNQVECIDGNSPV